MANTEQEMTFKVLQNSIQKLQIVAKLILRAFKE
jgi:hypothetical protein